MSLLPPIDIKKKFQPVSISGDNDKIQMFSFKNENDETMNIRTINVIPNMYRSNREAFNEDISIKRVINHHSNYAFNLDELLNCVPNIKIREYTQESRLDLITSFVEYFKQGWNDSSVIEGMTIDEASALFHLVTYDLTTWKNQKLNNLINNAKEKIKNWFSDNYGFENDNNEYHNIFTIPYLMYYRLLRTKTSNYYVLPYNNENLMQGNGFQGFETDFGLDSKNTMSKLGMIGSFISPNIQFTTTPIWRGIKGGEGKDIEFTVNLFNDSIENTINNFIFVNTIIAQNLPVQYHITQAPPSLYDIWIPGFDRLFMCDGEFSVNYKGVLRKMPDSYKTVKLFEGATKYKKGMVYIYEHIRIPDVYELKLKFKSLLPNSFNNFLYQFSSPMITNPDQEQKAFYDIEGVRDDMGSWLGERKENAKDISDFVKQIKEKYIQDNVQSKDKKLSETQQKELQNSKIQLYKYYEDHPDATSTFNEAKNNLQNAESAENSAQDKLNKTDNGGLGGTSGYGENEQALADSELKQAQRDKEEAQNRLNSIKSNMGLDSL